MQPNKVARVSKIYEKPDSQFGKARQSSFRASIDFGRFDIPGQVVSGYHPIPFSPLQFALAVEYDQYLHADHLADAYTLDRGGLYVSATGVGAKTLR